MADEPHDVVKLLLARMESHPEEFKLERTKYPSRWADILINIAEYGTAADNALLDVAIYKIRMSEVHEQVMEELCNGPERRRKETEEHEYERNLAKSLQHMKQQQLTVGTPYTDMNPIKKLLGTK